MKLKLNCETSSISTEICPAMLFIQSMSCLIITSQTRQLLISFFIKLIYYCRLTDNRPFKCASKTVELQMYTI